MAAPIFLRRWRSSSLPSEVINQANEGEPLSTSPAEASSTSNVRPGVVVLPILIMACSLIVLGLSIYGIHAYHGSEFDDSRPATPPTEEIPVFHLEILLCSLCLSVFGVITILCQVVTRRTERRYNGLMVFAMYFFLLCLTVGTLAWYGKHAEEGGYFEGIRIFYAIIGLMIALLVLLVMDMILAGNPLKKEHGSQRPPVASNGEHNLHPTKSSTPPAPNAVLETHDGVIDGHKCITGVVQPADVHYNPADPYHPLRLNPPEYSPAMETPSRINFRSPDLVAAKKVGKTAPEIPYQVVGDRTCFLCG